MTEAVSHVVEVRPATGDDAAGIRALLGAVGLPAEGVPDDGAGFVVAACDDRLVGIAGIDVDGSDGLLRSVAVDASRRGAGLGRRVVEAAIAHARARGVSRVHLLTRDAGPFFAHLGFVEVPFADLPVVLHGMPGWHGVACSGAKAMRRTA